MIRVCLTGWNGFLSKKLRENSTIQWTNDFVNSDILLLMGSPTFTNNSLSTDDAKIMHRYVKDTMEIVDKYTNKIIFCSTTGVDDIQLDHSGSTSYNLSKLYLENYILNNCSQSAILRIGTIISDKISDIEMMKTDRIQSRILKGDFKNIPLKDKYLHVNTFIDSTIDIILNFTPGIHNFNLVEYSLSELILLSKK